MIIKKRGLVAGNFDVIHPGYVKLFEDAKNNACNYLIVALQGDPTIERPYKCKPVQTVEERKYILESIKYVNEVIHYNTEKERTFIKENYPKAENISIDYAILEQSKAIYVLPATFDWNDLGTWGSLYDKLDKDGDNNAVVNSKVITEDARGNMIRSPKDKIVVVDGLNDFIIVDKEEVLMICPKSKEQSIKSVLAEVKKLFGDQYT